MEECADTLAFASEPVLASLANVLAYKEQLANTLATQSSGPIGKQNHPPTTSHRSTFVKEYELHELEVKYGLLQVRENAMLRAKEELFKDKRLSSQRDLENN